MNHTEDPHADAYSKTVFGFWIYLLTDFVLFATVLATYFVLRNSTFGGPGARDLLPLAYTFQQTFLLLTCAFTAGLANVFAHQRKQMVAGFLWVATLFFGALFLLMEGYGMLALSWVGNSWHKSAFLSAYFTLIGTHFVHVVFALIWTVLLLGFTAIFPKNPMILQRVSCLRLFWQFLAMIWVGIFTMVYLMGVS
jgi:cytochrome o ubiquinol oxidase subunit 3